MLAAVTISTCVVQSLIGWNAVMSAIGFVPNAAWHPSSWFATRTGQLLPVALTWLTYPFPHMNWAHMASNVLALLIFGSIVEPMMGSLRYVAFTVLASVLGVFGLAAIYPLGVNAIAGGSLLVCSILGAWLAAFSRAWWHRRRLWILAIEVAAVASLAAWLACRTPLSSVSALLALLWHAPSFMFGWLAFRIGSALQPGAVGQSQPG